MIWAVAAIIVFLLLFITYLVAALSAGKDVRLKIYRRDILLVIWTGILEIN